MPYIPEERRKAIFNDSNVDYNSNIENAGELNYFITTVIDDYLRYKGESYQAYNDIMGALEGAKMELYRRKTIPYENKKIIQNGDVYES